MILPAADALLAPVSKVDGFVLACLLDTSTGMVLASRQDKGDINLATAAAGAADMANVLSLLSSELGTGDGAEDVMVTFRHHFHVLRLIQPDAQPQILLLVILDRLRTNLALARREISGFCAGLAS